MLRFFSAILLVLLTAFQSKASHVMGGEITWTCDAGSYVFTLVFYRDCQGADVNTVSETIRVWNHPTLTSITLPFVSRTDISPTCTPVTGSPSPLTCGSGANGGNGAGAVEKIMYRSAPIAITGTPPTDGWVFTYENFSRSTALTNISNPSLYGITLAAKIYNTTGVQTGCVDNSPQFLQEPYIISCAGTPYVYSMNVVDPDLDSLYIDFGVPYNNFPSGGYNPPVNPAPVPFEPGFSYTNPTSDAAFNGSNVAAQLDHQSGELTFTSFTTGNYAVKVSVKSYRDGVLIAEVEREMQLIITPCNTNNNAPVVTAPFGGNSFETTVQAGTLVNFTLSATDNEILQDGTPQHNYLTTSGLMYGTNFTSASGCDIAPCATLNTAPIITGTQGVSADFSWQTSCDHLVGTNNIAQDTVAYYYVFKIQDDYCQVPKTTFATVKINVYNPGVINAPKISCIQTDASDNVTIYWSPVADPTGTFISYQIYSVQNGLLATINTINTNFWTHTGVTTQNDYYITVNSGCNGNTIRYSDTVSNIHLNLINPLNGTAILQWNNPTSDTINSYYKIYREYPTGTWTLMDSVPYGTTSYIDTIDICEAFLNYRIVLPNLPCFFTSNISGDTFEDKLTPDMPIISSVSIDTLTGDVTVAWNQNYQPDTYGYVIYTYDNNGFLYELDTVWGISSTSYTYSTNTSTGPLTYSVAAFDSCYTTAIPATFQTSAKAAIHTSSFLSASLAVCDLKVTLNWSAYVGWDTVSQYFVYGHITGQPWELLDSVNTLNYTVPVSGLKDYCFAILAVSNQGDSAFSNKVCMTITAPTLPAFNYLQVATVVGKEVQLEHLIDANSGVKAISVQRLNESNTFDEIGQVAATSNNLSYTDADVDVSKSSYTYRVQVIDSCGTKTGLSNTATTILLNGQKDDINLLSYLYWNAYSEFDGSVVAYNFYRGIDSVFNNGPIATLSPVQRSFDDDLNAVTFNGRVCYYVEAIEGSNVYNDSKISQSNVRCIVYEPLIYIPNAFTPEGLNPSFKPVLNNFDPQDYLFTVFDRWGQVIFQTDSPTEGWSGYVQRSAKIAETGTYIYMVTLHDGNGVEIVKRGHVTLLR